jgi:hypothetical protein
MKKKLDDLSKVYKPSKVPISSPDIQLNNRFSVLADEEITCIPESPVVHTNHSKPVGNDNKKTDVKNKYSKDENVLHNSSDVRKKDRIKPVVKHKNTKDTSDSAKSVSNDNACRSRECIYQFLSS